MTFNLLPIVVLGALAAGCGNETSTDTETPIEGSERASPAAYVMGPGRYAIEGGDGTVYSQTVVKPDGTYADLDGEGNEVGRGTSPASIRMATGPISRNAAGRIPPWPRTGVSQARATTEARATRSARSADNLQGSPAPHSRFCAI